MSEQTGEKTEQPTQRRLEDALKQGQIPRSAEVQTVCVLMGGLAALMFAGREIWQTLAGSTVLMLSHLHDTELSANSLQGYGVSGVLLLFKCAARSCSAPGWRAWSRARSKAASTPRPKCFRPTGAASVRSPALSGCFPRGCSCPPASRSSSSLSSSR